MPEDMETAVEWYTKAAEGGNECAMRELGKCYLDGHGIAQDRGKAAQLLEAAAEAGDVDAMMAIARCYSEGKLIVGGAVTGLCKAFT